MKLNVKRLGKKGIAIIAVSASLVVAAAVAIPVGIVYGAPNPNGEDASLPVAFTLPDASFTYGSIPTTNPEAPPPPDDYAGYVGTYLGAKVKTQSDIKDENSWKEGAPVDFKTEAVQTLNSNTVIEVTFRYAPPAGHDSSPVLGKQNYTVLPVYVTSFVGKYPEQEIPYGTSPASALFDLPTSPPDGLPIGKNDHPVIDTTTEHFQKTRYLISKTVQGVPKIMQTASLPDLPTYPAGVEIVASYYFQGTGNYAYGGNDGSFVTEKLFIIVKAKAGALAATESPFSFRSGSAPAKPEAPQKVAGYVGSFTKAVATDNSVTPAKETDVSDWMVDGTDDSKNLNKLSAGTKITVTYTYTLDEKNYEGTATVTSTQVFTIT